MDIVTLAAAMAYTKKTADALGAVKGAPCTITAIEPIAGGHKITFEWKSTSGQIETDTMDIMDGAEGQQGRTGPEGPAGPAGVSPSITIEQITGGHRVTITDAQHPQGQSFDVMDGDGGGNANFDISTVPLGGAGVYEVNAFLNNNDSERVRAIYSRGVNGELPEWFSMSVTSGLGTDDFHVATKEYADKEVAKKGNAKITFDNEYRYLQIRDDNGTDIGLSQETAGTVRVQEYAKDIRGQVQRIFDETLTSKAYVDGALANKQDTLVSGTNIKTVNGNILLGAGNIQIGEDFEVGAEKWYGTYKADGVTYQVYSKILDIGALPSTAGVTQYPHGITGIKQILQINGFTNDGFVMNAPRQNAQDNISIYQAQKNGNIAIEVGKDRSSKNGFVMMIYAKNN